eukprot:CAMPEP_0194039216 /NCGR_PEP_ID=MMETSP0009_2-20130614/11366_1 /TAXON_ID=210454 /ORGANISM="Grammatophora oceanica, Strain CCMP 410" /LENGTH=80 /DNA_ID=CAMNT_0038681969 /DNA_START=37 /DNA_END=275 /DNA_ORIENTATION=+
MASIAINIEGVGALKLSSREDYKDFLNDEGVKCLMMNGVRQSFGVLVNGGTYTLGPPPEPTITLELSLKTKKKSCSWKRG